VLSDSDTACALSGEDSDQRGLFRFMGVGTGSPESDITDVLGSPALRNDNEYDPALSSVHYQQGSWDRMMTFFFDNGICDGIMMVW